MSLPYTNEIPADTNISDYLAMRQAANYQQYMQDKQHFEFSKDPFQAFFYLVALNMDVTALAGISTTIQSTANQIEQLEWYVNQMTKIKNDFTKGKTDDSTATTIQLRKDIVILFEHMVPGSHPFTHPYGDKISYSDFQALIKAVHNKQIDPVLGQTHILNLIDMFMKGFGVLKQSDQPDLLLGTMTLKQLWDQGQENPAILQPYLNAMSSMESMTKGISGTETTRMDYLEKQYMNTLAFLKSMFNYYYQESKAPIGKEET